MRKEGGRHRGKKKKKAHPNAKLTFLKEHKRIKFSRQNPGCFSMKLWPLDVIWTEQERQQVTKKTAHASVKNTTQSQFLTKRRASLKGQHLVRKPSASLARHRGC